MASLPWDMIGGIFGLLSFLLTLLVEWKKLETRPRIMMASTIGIVMFFLVSSVARLFPPPGPGDMIVVLSDNFDGPSGNYDQSVWTCPDWSECGVDSAFLQNGVLNLRRDAEGLTTILSRSEWEYSKLISLSGKFQISRKGYQGQSNWTWISLHDRIACNLNGSESPTISCAVEKSAEYLSKEIPINFDTWYSVKLVFDHETNSVRFYVGDELIGEHVLQQELNHVQISLGMYSQMPNESLIDDIELISKP